MNRFHGKKKKNRFGLVTVAVSFTLILLRRGQHATASLAYLKGMERGLISVDRWAEGSQAYFLTHLHADHTQGLSSSWSKGPLFCSRITAKLLPVKFPNFNFSLLRLLDIGVWHSLSLKSPYSGSTVAFEVMPIDANHCPGISIWDSVVVTIDASVTIITIKFNERVCILVSSRLIFGILCINSLYQLSLYLHLMSFNHQFVLNIEAFCNCGGSRV